MQHKTHKDVQYNAPRFRCWKSKEKIQVKFGWKLKCDWHVKTRFHSDGSISLAGILKKKQKQRRNQKHKQNIIGARSNISIQLYIHGLTRLFHVSNHSTCTHSYLFVCFFVVSLAEAYQHRLNKKQIECYFNRWNRHPKPVSIREEIDRQAEKHTQRDAQRGTERNRERERKREKKRERERKKAEAEANPPIRAAEAV